MSSLSEIWASHDEHYPGCAFVRLEQRKALQAAHRYIQASGWIGRLSGWIGFSGRKTRQEILDALTLAIKRIPE